jgi:hypothetical protein
MPENFEKGKLFEKFIFHDIEATTPQASFS